MQFPMYASKVSAVGAGRIRAQIREGITSGLLGDRQHVAPAFWWYARRVPTEARAPTKLGVVF